MRLVGYKYEIQERRLRQLDQYCFDHDVLEATLPREAVEDFCYGGEYDSPATRQDRLRLLRKLTEHMEKSGCRVFVPPISENAFRYPKHQPYIYTKKELKDIFTEIDTWERAIQSNSNRKIVDPLLFRMLYGCGLRTTEALKLTVGDVDLDEGVLRILQSKNNKDRLVPMSGSLVDRCRAYSRTMHKLSPLDSYYFPGFHGGCYNQSTIYVRFRQYLWKAGISHSGNGPRVHDFRHAYCVHRLKEWVLDGQELTNFLPYLAAYLGHADFRGTEYYLRLTADLYPEIVSKMEIASGYIIPGRGEVQDEESCE
jgi:integrase